VVIATNGNRQTAFDFFFFFFFFFFFNCWTWFDPSFFLPIFLLVFKTTLLLMYDTYYFVDVKDSKCLLRVVITKIGLFT
jgi:hypothetical protein